VVPPGGNGETILIGRLGQLSDCALAALGNTMAAAPISAASIERTSWVMAAPMARESGWGLKAKRQAAQCSPNEKRMARLDPAGLIAKNQPDTFRGRANLLA
jgi:hypothetical protein